MDNELISIVSQLDTSINGLVLQDSLDPSRIRDIQNLSQQIHSEILNFKAEMDARQESFKQQIKSRVDDANRRITDLMSSSIR